VVLQSFLDKFAEKYFHTFSVPAENKEKFFERNLNMYLKKCPLHVQRVSD
jgi:hypothetical protein